ncbi:cupin domain-containing protein [Candidatus Binatus sp.]|jgi:mannose-6-phosphate isomerase-like protein (cupin superfamily)|uniref:cupin domain-containing protein n=1 Tax=Candidatus Binatus sp. TaxID=2811406 RepID=UPI003BCF01F6
MLQPTVMTLSEVHVHVRPRGPAEFVAKDFSNVTRLGDTMVWDPAVDGILWGESRQNQSGDHGGERHLDSDEVLYLISGAFRLSIELEAGPAEIPVRAGQAVIVPQGIWHRLLVDEPCHFLYFGGGRTEIRRHI